jgi:hypothetical protein
VLTRRRGPTRLVLNPGSDKHDATSVSSHAVLEAAWSEAAIEHRYVVAIGHAGKKQMRCDVC